MKKKDKVDFIIDELNNIKWKVMCPKPDNYLTHKVHVFYFDNDRNVRTACGRLLPCTIGFYYRTEMCGTTVSRDVVCSECLKLVQKQPERYKIMAIQDSSKKWQLCER